MYAIAFSAPESKPEVINRMEAYEIKTARKAGAAIRHVSCSSRAIMGDTPKEKGRNRLTIPINPT
jgi:hypothetical protein